MCLIKKIVSFPLLASIFALLTSLFAFGKGQGPTCDWPGGLAGRCPPTASISAKSRQLSPSRHTLQTSLFTLHSSLFAFGKGQGPTCDWPGGLAGRAAPPRLPSLNFRHSHVISLHRFSAAASGRPHARAASSLGLGWHAERRPMLTRALHGVLRNAQPHSAHSDRAKPQWRGCRCLRACGHSAPEQGMGAS